MTFRTTGNHHGSTSRLVHTTIGDLPHFLASLEHGCWAMALFNRIGDQSPLLVDVSAVN